MLPPTGILRWAAHVQYSAMIDETFLKRVQELEHRQNLIESRVRELDEQQRITINTLVEENRELKWATTIWDTEGGTSGEEYLQSDSD